MIETIRESVKAALTDMGYDLSELTDTMVLGPAGLDLESLAVAELAVRIEDEFGVGFSNDELPGMGDLTLDGFSSLVAERAGATSSSRAGD